MGEQANRSEIERLENAFWQSMLDGRPEVATAMLTDPALMVSGHGTIKFDHAAYLRMAKDARHKLVGFDITDLDVTFPREDVAVATYQVNQRMEMDGKSVEKVVFDTSTWVTVDGEWRCAMHTESAAAAKP